VSFTGRSQTIDGTPGNAEDTAWALTDHQGTVRDVVDSDATGDTVTVPLSPATRFTRS